MKMNIITNLHIYNALYTQIVYFQEIKHIKNDFNFYIISVYFIKYI